MENLFLSPLLPFLHFTEIRGCLEEDEADSPLCLSFKVDPNRIGVDEADVDELIASDAPQYAFVCT